MSRALAAVAVTAALVACGVAGATRRPVTPPPSMPEQVETGQAMAGVGGSASTVTATPSPAPAAPAPPPGRCPLGEADADGTTPLERALRDALRDARFDRVVDLDAATGKAGPAGTAGSPSATGATSPRRVPRIAHRPSVDAAVIAFPDGCPPVFANAMSSRELPAVRLNRFDPASLSLQGVRLRRWDQARWDAPDPATPFTADDDVVPGQAGEGAVDFTVPYPASGFKLLVAVKVLELVDRGVLGLEDRIVLGKRTRALREWMADMITVSDDESTRALVKTLHAVNEEAGIDKLFARLGLGALQIHETSAETGRNWQPGQIHMSAWDTARLLWLLDPDAPPPSWTTPSGAPVDPGFLRPESKRLLVGLLHAQAFQDVLSTTALCRLPKTRKGIPALLPERWIGADGRPAVAIGRGVSADMAGDDVRSCNAQAEVTFAHKTGLTENFGSDLGIVRGIPGRARRHYIVAFFSNLGTRYTDADKASDPDPCHNLGICYTQRIAGVGAAIDTALRAALEPVAPGKVPPSRSRR